MRHALSALSQHSFDVTFREVARLHLAGGVPSARRRALEAELRGDALSETGVVHFTSVRQFRGRFSSSRSGTAYVKVSGGAFLVSINGGPYRAATAVERRVLTAFVRDGFSFVSPRARHVDDNGPRVVDGAAVEEYSASFSAGAVAAQLGGLVQLPAHTSIAGGTVTLDIDRATGLPVHISDVVSLTTDLAAERPGLRGGLITTATSTRTFRFDPPR